MNRQNKRMRMVSLFSGIGGFELGFQTAGVETVLMSEIDEAAQQVLRTRFPGKTIIPDVCSVSEIPKGTDILCAGFPCQDLSSVGEKRGMNGHRSSLVREVFRLLGNRRTEWVVFENVSFMRSLNQGEALRYIISSLERLGYNWAYRTIDSISFLPQHRKRIYIAASLNHDARTALLCGDEPGTDRKVDSSVFQYPLGFYWTEGRYSLGLTHNGIPTLKAGSTIGIPSPPAIAFPDGEISTPDIRDAERLQGFPPGWTEPATQVAKPSIRWKQVGNAVTVNTIAWIANNIISPQSYNGNGDRPLRPDAKLPGAAWGNPSQRYISCVSEFPVPCNAIALEQFLQFPRTPLSLRAATGFLNRLISGRMKAPQYFIETLQNHISNLS